MRLATIYVAAFATAVAILGVVTYFVITGVMQRQLDARVENEALQLAAIHASGGLTALTEAVRKAERRRPDGVRGLAVSKDGARVAGGLDTWPSSAGWSEVPNPQPDSESATRRYFVTDLQGGVALALAADQEQIEDAREAIFDGFVSAFGTVLVLGIAGGLGLSFLVLRRVETIRRTAQAIIAGDLTRRVPVRGTNDDFDRLSQTLNQMLDRIGELMTSLRQVSANIAHDLKSPLARLRHRLESAQTMIDADARPQLGEAIEQVDDILATFSALLRIAQIEAGTRRAGFARFNLSTTFLTVAEAFAPAAEDAGQTLAAAIEPDLEITGDRELVTQMLANVVENAIHHTGPGTRIAVALRRDATGIMGIIADNGPGVPLAERDRIFDRFHRLPQSHGVAGNGLGLSLVKAVAEIHDIAVAVEDAGPGFRLTLRFKEAPPRSPGLWRD